MATLLEDKAIWIEDHFLPDGDALFTTLVNAVAWDEPIRARKAASFGLPYNYSGIVWPKVPFPSELLLVLDRVTARLGYI